MLIHRIPAVPRHQLVLWVVPLYWSGHYGLHTGHILTHPNGQRHVRWKVKHASAAILHESSVHWESVKKWQEEEQQGHWIIMCNMWCFCLACSYVQDTLEQPDQGKTQQGISRSIASSYWTCSVLLSDLSRVTYHNSRRAESVVGRQSMPSRTRLCPRNGEAKRHFRTQWCTSSCLPDRFESGHKFCMMTSCYIILQTILRNSYRIHIETSYVCQCYEYFYIYILLFGSIRPGCIVYLTEYTELGCSSFIWQNVVVYFAVRIQNTFSTSHYKIYILCIIMYVSLKQCGERLLLVVMFTITFIHYMMVIYYVSEVHSCARQSKTTNFFSKRSRGNKLPHENTRPRQVMASCQTKCSKFGIWMHITQSWTYCIHT